MLAVCAHWLPAAAKSLITSSILAGTFSWHCWRTELYRLSMTVPPGAVQGGGPASYLDQYAEQPAGSIWWDLMKRVKNSHWDLTIHRGLETWHGKTSLWCTLCPEADGTCNIPFEQTTAVEEWWLARNDFILASHSKMVGWDFPRVQVDFIVIFLKYVQLEIF